MSDTPSNPTAALPFIKNAGPLRNKLLAMQPNETVDVKPEELPRYYKSPKPILSNIQRSYEFYFGVHTLSNRSGWRVKRLASAEEAQNFNPKKKRTRSARQIEPERLYNLTDAGLIELILKKVAIATRDIADLTPRGITLADINTLDADNRAFAAMFSDVQLQAEESGAVEIKEAARGTLENRLGNLRTMAENTFGSASVEYEVFSFEGMADETDDKLLRLAKRALRQGNINQAAMAAWGCSPAFLLQLGTDITDFDNKIDDVYATEADRKKATVLRIKTGNGLFNRVTQVCNTGKDFYRPISEAKWNDYLIYS